MNYLLRPPASTSDHHRPRPRSATAVLVVYSILLLLVGATYFRLLYTVATNPGYVERGPQWYEKNEKDAKRNDVKNGATRLRGHDLRRPRRRNMERSRPQGGSQLEGFDYMSHSTTSTPTAVDEASRDLQAHYEKQVFVCQGDGRPIWCSSCMNWRPDRSHHCREINRCVRKMDHFCPWWVPQDLYKPFLFRAKGKPYRMRLTSSRVAGVIGEMTFKFFIQYCSWTAVYCLFILVIMAIVIAEERAEVSLLFLLIRFFFFAPRKQGTLGGFTHHTSFSELPAMDDDPISAVSPTLSKP